LKLLAVLPTYNEVENINNIMDALLEYDFLDILVVDDNSTDGTKDKVNTYIEELGDRVKMHERPGKLGLGTAYIDGFKIGLEGDYDCFMEIDADLSHDPVEIPNFIKKIEDGYDLIVGSRYLNGTISVVGWDFKRLLLSKFGNFYASTLLHMRKYTDMTSGYRCFSRKALETIPLDGVKSNGYAFQIEMVYLAVQNDLRVTEIPIIFYEREHGGSKMSNKIVREAIALPFRLKYGKK